MSTFKRVRSAITGRFIKRSEADPDTSVEELVATGHYLISRNTLVHAVTALNIHVTTLIERDEATEVVNDYALAREEIMQALYG
jgi:hypothetical protein